MPAAGIHLNWTGDGNLIFDQPGQDLDPALGDLYGSTRHKLARNEVSILHRGKTGEDVLGRIDRVVVTENDVILVEYKTTAHAAPDNARDLAGAYVPQLQLYAEGIRRIWPDKHLRALIIFTRCVLPVEVDLDA